MSETVFFLFSTSVLNLFPFVLKVIFFQFFRVFLPNSELNFYLIFLFASSVFTLEDISFVLLGFLSSYRSPFILYLITFLLVSCWFLRCLLCLGCHLVCSRFLLWWWIISRLLFPLGGCLMAQVLLSSTWCRVRHLAPYFTTHYSYFISILIFMKTVMRIVTSLI